MSTYEPASVTNTDPCILRLLVDARAHAMTKAARDEYETTEPQAFAVLLWGDCVTIRFSSHERAPVERMTQTEFLRRYGYARR